jgi:hypothetical protein
MINNIVLTHKETNKMAITKLKHHDNCEVRVEQLHNHTHYARLICADHNTHIQWLNQAQAREIAPITNSKFEVAK